MKPETRDLLDSAAARKRGVYLAGPSGFNDAGRLWHSEVLLPKVRAAGLVPLDPWADQSALEDVVGTMPWGAERRARLSEANLDQGRLDLDMVLTCAAVLACLDGPQVDDGTAIEIGYAHHAGKLIVGLRTDIRVSSDNEGAMVNLMIETCVVDSGGIMTRDVDDAVEHIRERLIG
jgi:nucleoside 2-deoxyribosyltransferase